MRADPRPGPGGFAAPGAGGRGCRFRLGGGAAGIQRLEAELVGQAFAPHRHDTYAVGVTLSGVQTFRYRGEQRHCLPGQWHILHPDELHDGAAGTGDGFGYRIFYLDPALVQDALGGLPLPFVADPVIPATGMPRVLGGFLADIGEPLDELEAVEVTTAIADSLRAHASPARGRPIGLDMEAMRRIRSLLLDDPTTRHRAGDLEAASGLDRWTIARQFRAAYGTSPTRFRTMRRLDLARALLLGGNPPAAAATAAGFADQAHLTRMFKHAYGLTPATWAAAVHVTTSRTVPATKGPSGDKCHDTAATIPAGVRLRQPASPTPMSPPPRLQTYSSQTAGHVKDRAGDTRPLR
ncbi:AraC family transcriptional regulator [Sinosporangium siamense]|uniref:AraC family transcriptional regulator n=1 Tax=Sinosporangium siamense TaxID=1367973 RepID=A0A919V9R5_9ACTN|nr:AraC family transcriptional regulator [Sinosporangium siamense]GII90394.1 AraC family transcriptional regulator [Sinosporangium siamense]